MQRPQYDNQGQSPQYNRPAYNNNGYNMSRGVDDMQQQGYNQPPANYYQQPQGYPMGNPMYSAPQGYPAEMAGYRGGRGRGWYYPNAGRGGYNMRGGFRGGRGGYPIRRKKPFVGGTLETQREWEHQTACCFYRQGACKFGEACRFLHEDGEGHPCQFGDKCRVHGTAKEEGEQPAAEEVKKDEKVEEKAAAPAPANAEEKKE